MNLMLAQQSSRFVFASASECRLVLRRLAIVASVIVMEDCRLSRSDYLRNKRAFSGNGYHEG
jgi:hypothetical protein